MVRSKILARLSARQRKTEKEFKKASRELSRAKTFKKGLKPFGRGQAAIFRGEFISAERAGIKKFRKVKRRIKRKWRKKQAC